MTNSFARDPRSAAVDSGTLSSFVPPARAEVRADMLDSLLLAQLAADKKFSRLEEPKDWYRLLGDTLGKVAWSGASFEFGNFDPGGDEFTLSEVIAKVVARRVDAEQAAAVRAAMDTLFGLPDDDARVLVYQGAAVSEHDRNLLVSVAAGTAITVVGVLFRTEQRLERPLTDPYRVAELDGPIVGVSACASLNEEIYRKIRAGVIEKLGDRRRELILELFETQPGTAWNGLEERHGL